MGAKSSTGMLRTVRRALSLFTRYEKRRGLLVLALVVLMALLETAGVASVLPFLAVLGNPELVESNPFLAAAFAALGFADTEMFLLSLGLGAFVVVILAAAVRVLTVYAMNRFTEMRGHSLAERLLECYLRQPYAFFLDRHSGDLATGILSEVYLVVGNVYRPAFYVLAYSVVALALVGLLVVVDPVLALVVGCVISFLYLATFLAARRLLDRMGEGRVAANKERFLAAGEALGGIKDIKLLGREDAYLSRFRPASLLFSRYQANSAFLSEAPKYLIEAIAVGGVLALAIFLSVTATAGESILPVLGLYAFAGYKLLPAAQQIYAGVARLRYGAASLDGLHEDLRHRAALAEARGRKPPPLRPARMVALERVSFTYAGAVRPALHDIDLEIPVGSSLGIVGTTGSGKTTLVDLLLGLLRPTEGHLVVDGVPIDDRSLRAWQLALGYVPQTIFLADSSIAENIAFGVATDAIDRAQVERCARMAQIHDFIIGELPKGYDTRVGERGIRLSGGQRQRIGIARALQHEPSVLVLDEGTSALDTTTERVVMDAIRSLSRQKTVVIIAHRLSTVRACDRIALLDAGRIVDIGDFDQLSKRNLRFAELAEDRV